MRKLLMLALWLLAANVFAQSQSPAASHETPLALVGLIFGMSIGLAFCFFLIWQHQKRQNLYSATHEAENQRLEKELMLTQEELQEKKTSLGLLNQRLVSEFSQREKIEKASFARDRFLATMSIEMRTPLNIITGLTRLLRDSDLRPEQAEHLRNLQFAANDLVVFINDVLNFSKIEAGKLKLDEREFAPTQALDDIRRRFERLAAEKGLGFNYIFDTDIPERLIGDDTRLHQILTNLLFVLLQNTSGGSLELHVDLIEATGKEALLQIFLEGNTHNLESHTLGQLFEPSPDEQETEFEGYEGCRLSLAIAKRLTELQNGLLKMQTLPGKPTVFTAILPYKLPQSQPEKLVPVATRFSDQLAGKRILIVEDNKINQLVVAKMLRKQGVEVTTADDGLEALEIFQHQNFDLVLMDIQMPQLDGYRATAQIRRHADLRKRNVPIIALTSSAFLTEKEKANLFGMDDHVGKPFSPEELLEKICANIVVQVSA